MNDKIKKKLIKKYLGLPLKNILAGKKNKLIIKRLREKFQLQIVFANSPMTTENCMPKDSMEIR